MFYYQAKSKSVDLKIKVVNDKSSVNNEDEMDSDPDTPGFIKKRSLLQQNEKEVRLPLLLGDITRL